LPDFFSMKTYQHYSFDLWMTLIRSNPSFKPERAKLFHSRYNPLGKSVEEIIGIFQQVDLVCNAINEQTGKDIDAEEMYLWVVMAMNDYQPDSIAELDPVALYQECEELMWQHPPLLYAPNTLEVLQKLKTRGNCSMSLLSNTGFVKGKTLRKVLANLGIAECLDFQLYSDEEGLSKPNPAFFQHMYQLATEKAREKGQELLSPQQVLHVGDNPRADFAGAQKQGMRALLINSNHLNIEHLVPDL
jgi:putative hydrolase of the HAD superfamily